MSLGALIREAKRVIDEEELPHPGQIESMGFIRDDMDAEMAIELDSSGVSRQSGCILLVAQKLGSNAEYWISRGRHWEKLKKLLTILGGDKSLFALGMESRAGDDWPRRINVYARKARDFELLFCAFHVVCVAGTPHESLEASSQFRFSCPDFHTR